MSIGARLKELRMRKGKSLQQVADAVGASKAHIWELETGKSHNPSLDLLKRLAEYFKVTVAALIGETLEEDDSLLVLYRDMKDLKDEDRQLLESIIASMKERQKGK